MTEPRYFESIAEAVEGDAAPDDLVREPGGGFKRWGDHSKEDIAAEILRLRARLSS